MGEYKNGEEYLHSSKVLESLNKGYVMLPRAIYDGPIGHASPCAREMYNFFLSQANHQTINTGGTTFHRGELFTSYKEIIEALHWRVGYRKVSYSKDQCEAAMKTLVKTQMITTRKTTRGLVITVCNYDHWQTASNYENHTEDHKKTTMYLYYKQE